MPVTRETLEEARQNMTDYQIIQHLRKRQDVDKLYLNWIGRGMDATTMLDELVKIDTAAVQKEMQKSKSVRERVAGVTPEIQVEVPVGEKKGFVEQWEDVVSRLSATRLREQLPPKMRVYEEPSGRPLFGKGAGRFVGAVAPVEMAQLYIAGRPRFYKEYLEKTKQYPNPLEYVARRMWQGKPMVEEFEIAGDLSILVFGVGGALKAPKAIAAARAVSPKVATTVANLSKAGSLFIKASDFIDPTNIAIQGMFRAYGTYAHPALKQFLASQTSIKPWVSKLAHWKNVTGASDGIRRIATLDLQYKLTAASGNQAAFDEMVGLLALKRAKKLTPEILGKASPEANMLYKRTTDWLETDIAKSPGLGLSTRAEDVATAELRAAEAAGDLATRREVLAELSQINQRQELADAELMLLSSLYGNVPTRKAAWKWMDKTINQPRGGSWRMFKSKWTAQVLESGAKMDEVLKSPATIVQLKEAMGERADEWFDDLVNTYKFQAQNNINELSKAKTPNVEAINKWKHKLSVIENYERNIKGREAEIISAREAAGRPYEKPAPTTPEEEIMAGRRVEEMGPPEPKRVPVTEAPEEIMAGRRAEDITEILEGERLRRLQRPTYPEGVPEPPLPEYMPEEIQRQLPVEEGLRQQRELERLRQLQAEAEGIQPPMLESRLPEERLPRERPIIRRELRVEQVTPLARQITPEAIPPTLQRPAPGEAIVLPSGREITPEFTAEAQWLRDPEYVASQRNTLTAYLQSAKVDLQDAYQFLQDARPSQLSASRDFVRRMQEQLDFRQRALDEFNAKVDDVIELQGLYEEAGRPVRREPAQRRPGGVPPTEILPPTTPPPTIRRVPPTTPAPARAAARMEVPTRRPREIAAPPETIGEPVFEEPTITPQKALEVPPEGMEKGAEEITQPGRTGEATIWRDIFQQQGLALPEGELGDFLVNYARIADPDITLTPYELQAIGNRVVNRIDNAIRKIKTTEIEVESPDAMIETLDGIKGWIKDENENVKLEGIDRLVSTAHRVDTSILPLVFTPEKATAMERSPLIQQTLKILDYLNSTDVVTSKQYLSKTGKAIGEAGEVAAEVTPSIIELPKGIARMRVDDLTLDPDRFQYKVMKGAGGVTGTLKQARQFEEKLAGTVAVWKDPETGKTFVVNGHNRVELARRSGVDSINVQYLDVTTAEEARTDGALINIAEGRGTAIDAAKLFRDKEITKADLEAKGIALTEKMASDGIALSNLHPAIFNPTSRGEFPLERAIVIGRKLTDQNQQLGLVKLIEKQAKKGKTITNDVISELADMITSAPTTQATEMTLFGPEVIEQTFGLEKADVLSYVRSRLSREQKLFGVVSRARNVQELVDAGNVIDIQTNQNISKEAAQLLDIFDRVKHTKGDIANTINDAAQRIGKGENASAVKESTYEKVRDQLSTFIERGERQGVTGAEGVPEKQLSLDVTRPKVELAPSVIEPAAEVTPSAAKEPWQMTSDEYASFVGYKKSHGTRVRENWRGQHEGIVRIAAQQGKPVPPEVLADYPDLAKAAPSAATHIWTTGEGDFPVRIIRENKVPISAKPGETGMRRVIEVEILGHPEGYSKARPEIGSIIQAVPESVIEPVAEVTEKAPLPDGFKQIDNEMYVSMKTAKPLTQAEETKLSAVYDRRFGKDTYYYVDVKKSPQTLDRLQYSDVVRPESVQKLLPATEATAARAVNVQDAPIYAEFKAATKKKFDTGLVGVEQKGDKFTTWKKKSAEAPVKYLPVDFDTLDDAVFAAASPTENVRTIEAAIRVKNATTEDAVEAIADEVAESMSTKDYMFFDKVRKASLEKIRGVRPRTAKTEIALKKVGEFEPEEADIAARAEQEFERMKQAIDRTPDNPTPAQVRTLDTQQSKTIVTDYASRLPETPRNWVMKQKKYKTAKIDGGQYVIQQNTGTKATPTWKTIEGHVFDSEADATINIQWVGDKTKAKTYTPDSPAVKTFISDLMKAEHEPQLAELENQMTDIFNAASAKDKNLITDAYQTASQHVRGETAQTVGKGEAIAAEPPKLDISWDADAGHHKWNRSEIPRPEDIPTVAIGDFLTPENIERMIKDLPKQPKKDALQFKSALLFNEESILIKNAGEEGRRFFRAMHDMANEAQINANVESMNIMRLLEDMKTPTRGARAKRRIGEAIGLPEKWFFKADVEGLSQSQAAMEGKIPVEQLKPRARRLVEATRDYIKRDAEYAKGKKLLVRITYYSPEGVKGYDYLPWASQEIEYYWPHYRDLTNEQTFKAFVEQEYTRVTHAEANRLSQADPSLSAADALKQAEEKIKLTQVQDWVNRRRFALQGRLADHLEFARQSEAPGYRKDWDVILSRIKEGEWRKAEIKYFGMKDERATALIDAIRKKYGDDMGNFAEQTFRRFVGDITEPYIPWLYQLNKYTGTWNVLSLMSMSWLNQLGQFFNIPERVGMINSLRGVGRMITKEGKRYATETAAAMVPTFEYSLLSQPYAQRYLKSVWAGMFWQWDRLWREITANATVPYVKKYADNLLQNAGKTGKIAKTRFNTAKRMLEEVGIEADDIIKRGYIEPQEMRMASKHIADETQFAGRTYEIPRGWQHPAVRFMFSTFKNFAYQQSRFQYKMARRMASEMAKGNFTPLKNLLVGVFGAYIAGESIIAAKAFMTGSWDEHEWMWERVEKAMDADTRYKKAYKLANAILEPIGQASLLGLFWDMSRAAASPYPGLLATTLAPAPRRIVELGVAIPINLIQGKPKKALREVIGALPQGTQSRKIYKKFVEKEGQGGSFGEPLSW